jgi:hypothetical protein
MNKPPVLSIQRQSLDALVLAREDACRALERGDVEIEYRGWWIEVVDHNRGWDYVLDGRHRDPPLEGIFEEIDELEGMSEEEIQRLAEAWQNRRVDSLS